MEFEFKEKYSMSDLLKIIEILRSPEGCPWDRVQTHKSIRSNFIEEVYEAIEAIDLEDSENLMEELGDVLLQIVFHCSLEKQNGSFDFNDVVDAICKKLLVRHPHVFSDVKAKNSKQALEVWDEMKRKTNKETPKESIERISKFLPELMRTQKIQNKAAKEGYGIFSVEEAIIETFDRLHYLSTVIMKGIQGEYDDAVGDLLFSVAEIGRLIDVDAENALYNSSKRFTEKFYEKLTLEKQSDI